MLFRSGDNACTFACGKLDLEAQRLLDVTKESLHLGIAAAQAGSLFRGVAAPLGCVICLQLGDVAVFSLCAQYFLNVRGGGGITTLGAFHTFRKPCVARG